MTPLRTPLSPAKSALTNGSGAAAILSAAIGCFALSILAIAADKSTSVKAALIFYKPTGALSGVTSSSILIWFLTWGILDIRWRKRTIALGWTCGIAFTLLILSFLLTYPPIADLF
jgi:hypothetical protein